MEGIRDPTPDTEAILRSGIKVTIHAAMSVDYFASMPEAIRKVARHYTV